MKGFEPIQEANRRGHSTRGFSLLEVLVALMILSVGAASVLALFGAAASTHRRSLDRTHAGLVAERILAEIQGRYTVDKSVGELREELARELPSFYGDYAWEAYLFQPARQRGEGRREAEEAERSDWQEQELFARVFVRWKQSGHSRAESFYTILLPRNVPIEPEERRRRSSSVPTGRRLRRR